MHEALLRRGQAARFCWRAAGWHATRVVQLPRRHAVGVARAQTPPSIFLAPPTRAACAAATRRATPCTPPPSASACCARWRRPSRQPRCEVWGGGAWVCAPPASPSLTSRPASLTCLRGFSLCSISPLPCSPKQAEQLDPSLLLFLLSLAHTPPTPPPHTRLAPPLQDKLLDRAPGAFGGYRGGRREAGLLAAACEAYEGAPPRPRAAAFPLPACPSPTLLPAGPTNMPLAWGAAAQSPALPYSPLHRRSDNPPHPPAHPTAPVRSRGAAPAAGARGRAAGGAV